MITNIKLIRLADIPDEYQDDLLFGLKGDYKFGDYAKYTVKDWDIKPNTLDAYLVLIGCIPSEQILIHFIW